MTARARCRQPSRPRRPGGSAQPDVVGRLPPSLDRRGPAPWGRRSRPLLAPRRRRVPEGRAGRPARRGRPGDGGLAKREGRGPPSSFGPGPPPCERAVPAPHGRPRPHLLDEPGRQGLGHLGDGTLPVAAQDRTDRPQGLAHPRHRPGRPVRPLGRFPNPTRPPPTGGHPSPATFERQAVLPRLPAHETSSRPSCPGQCR